MIETRVRGNVAEVRAGARWLRDTLGRGLGEASDLTTAAHRQAAREWSGLSAEAYAHLTTRTVGLLDDQVRRIDRAAAAWEAYAAELEQVLGRMASLRSEAVAGGLAVTGTVIHPPVPGPNIGPSFGPDPEVLYDRLARAVAETAAGLAEWIATHLGAAAHDAQENGGTRAVVEFLQASALPFQRGVGLFLARECLTGASDWLGDLAEQHHGSAEDLRSAHRSGNPARRVLGQAPETPGRIHALTEAAETAATSAKVLRYAPRLLGPVGLVTDGYFAYQDLQAGTSPGEVVVSNVASYAAEAGVAAAVAGSTLSTPVVVTAVAAGAVGVGVSWGVAKGWEALPDEATDTVDDALVDAYDASTNLAQDGWKKVSGWQ